MHCAKCGAEYDEDIKFCGVCGAKMAGADSKVAPSVRSQTKGTNPFKKQHAVQTELDPIQNSRAGLIPQVVTPVSSNGSQTNSADIDLGNKAKIAFIISIVALVAVLLFSIILPMLGIGLFNSGAAEIVGAGKAEITIKAGNDSGLVQIYDEDCPYIVIATPDGWNSEFSRVSFDSSEGNLVVYTDKIEKTDITRKVMWVAYQKK